MKDRHRKPFFSKTTQRKIKDNAKENLKN